MKQRPQRQNSTNGQKRAGANPARNSGNTFTRGTGHPQQQPSEYEVALNDKLVHLVAKSVGKSCIATVGSGARYQGLLLSADLLSTEPGQTASSLSIILQNVSVYSKALIDEKGNLNPDALPEKLIIQSKDLMDLEVHDVDLKSALSPKPEAKAQAGPATPLEAPAAPSAIASTVAGAASERPILTESTFKTDTDISGKLKFKERELTKWVPDDDSKTLSLEDDSGGKWDQFKVNEEKFGIGSTYDEHLYTTRIDKTNPEYQERLRYADRVAREIEGQVTTDPHLLEERGIQVNDGGVDEEDKYSGVDRRGDELMAALRGVNINQVSEQDTGDAASSPNRYLPPRQRAAQYHDDPAIISSSAIAGARSNAAKADKPDSIPIKPPVPNESFRLNAQSEINSLREFSANFKIPHEIPQDLLPILSKDKSKQSEIVKKLQELLQKDSDDLQDRAASLKDTLSKVSEVASNAPRKIKMDPTKPAFKLNPKAAAFTPSSKQFHPPAPIHNKSPSNLSPRSNNPRAFNNVPNSSGSSTGSKRHHVTAIDFFGGANKIPTKEGQRAKSAEFKVAFNVFITTKKLAKELNTAVEFERTYITPPTWESNVDVPYEELFPSPNILKPLAPVAPVAGAMPFIANPIVGSPSPGGVASPMLSSGYPGTPSSGKFPISPQQQHHQQLAAMAAHFQQQQFQAAMMFQQQQQQPLPIHQQYGGGIPPGQPPMPMYGPGGEPYLPPSGYMMPQATYVGGVGSPINGHVVSAPYNGPNVPAGGKHNGGKRYQGGGGGDKKG